jgi:Ala-tRNA(Pro) deacylase
MSCQERLEEYLHSQHVPFQVQQHKRSYTAQEVAESEHIPGKMVAKMVMVFADESMVLLVLPASYVVDFSWAESALGAKRLRLASETEFAAAFPDCEIGTMPPFGNLYGLPVYVDSSLTEDETIIFPAGTHTETMSVRFADFQRVVRPTIGEFARPRGFSALS